VAKDGPDNILEVSVGRIGARGDGIAESPMGLLYIPYAATGDRLHVRVGGPRGDGRTARIETILDPSPDRAEPTCRHFGTCGGCSLQHLSDAAVATLKCGLVATALRRKALPEDAVADTVTAPPRSRRRVSLAFHRGGATVLGFNERASRQILNIRDCPVMRPALMHLLSPLRGLCADLDALGRSADLHLTETASGIDVLILPARAADPGLEGRETLARFAETHDLCRISWGVGTEIEPIVQRREAVMRFGGAAVALPPGAFLQASEAGEAAIQAAATAAIADSGAARIADLYAGCGAFSFPLAKIAPVHAVEGDETLAAALTQAAQGHPVTVERRDLQRDPMTTAALNDFDAVLFDPPRAGAKPTAEALALSHVPLVVAVSCNPATLARDLHILVDGGYRLERVTPIDQFTWSAHVEAVAVLRR
jgi:23S rRNA (uracil1939-C5)-methyltransferase